MSDLVSRLIVAAREFTLNVSVDAANREKEAEDALRAELAAKDAEIERLRGVLSWHHCDTHGDIDPVAWGCPECVRELRQELDNKNFEIGLWKKWADEGGAQ